MSDELRHYGVLGMHWGVRKDKNGVRRGTPRRDRKTEKSEDHKVSRDLKRHPLSTLSNTELKTITKRMKLENEFDQLTSDRAALQRGHKKAKAILAIAGTASAAYALGQSPLGKMVKSAIQEKFKK